MERGWITAPKVWSKAEEIALLDELIKKLGPYSYMGPWLRLQRDMVVNAIHCDLPIPTAINH